MTFYPFFYRQECHRFNWALPASLLSSLDFYLLPHFCVYVYCKIALLCCVAEFPLRHTRWEGERRKSFTISLSLPENPLTPVAWTMCSVVHDYIAMFCFTSMSSYTFFSPPFLSFTENSSFCRGFFFSWDLQDFELSVELRSLLFLRVTLWRIVLSQKFGIRSLGSPRSRGNKTEWNSAGELRGVVRRRMSVTLNHGWSSHSPTCSLTVCFMCVNTSPRTTRTIRSTSETTSKFER